MYISKLKIKNFKCFDEVEINFDPNFNLIIGENNSGKSTIFDALRLWQLAFKEFLKDRTNNQQSSFRVTQNFSFTIDDIAFLRIIDFNNLFNNKGQKKFEITLCISIDDEEVNLPIIFISTTKGKVLNFELCKKPDQRLIVSQKISALLKIPSGSDFKELFLFTYINPLFLLPNKEPHYSKGYILNKLHEAKANEIIRNIIYTLSPERKKIKKDEKSEKLIEIEKSIKEILKIDEITFSKRLEEEESFIKIFAKNEYSSTEVEINQLGSGSINVLNILSVLAYGDYENFNLNALLLDEPDSHLHFNHQSRLYNYLNRVSGDKNKQIFIITHNSSLISQFEKILFIEKNKKIINTISLDDYLDNHLKQIDENHYNVMKELSQAKKEKEEVEKQLNEIKNLDIPIVYTEGPSDVVILENAFKKLYPEETIKFQVVSGYSCTQLKNTFENKKTFEKNNNTQIAIFDFDTAYSQWNGLWNGKEKKFIDIEKDPFKALSKKHSDFNAYAMLLPIPNIDSLKNQVLDPDNSNINFGDKSILQIEHLLFDVVSLKESFEIKNIVAGGKCIYFKGDKLIFAEKTKNLSKEDYKHFIPLFEKIAKLINCKLPKVEINA
jgi:energy-coupling factor transporter ATP-binding protein EcfA2